MTAYRFFSIQKCFGYNQFNNIVETTQLNNDQMPEIHCRCECSKCSPAPSNNNSLQSPYLSNLLQPCRSVKLNEALQVIWGNLPQGPIDKAVKDFSSGSKNYCSTKRYFKDFYLARFCRFYISYKVRPERQK